MPATAVVPSRSLLLNASREPLCLISVRRAVVLVLANKAVVLESNGRELHSERDVLPMPVVTCLTKYIHVPYRTVSAPTRRTVLYRDNFQCAYCRQPAATVDHVIPRSRGGDHVWTNVVAACMPCNHKKADRLLSELGWKIAFRPTSPPTAISLVSSGRHADPAWNRYLKVA